MSTLTFDKPKTASNTPERKAFRQLVYPALRAMGALPHGQLVDAEGTSQDKRAGIDWIISQADGTQHTVACRIQWQTDWGTFSIRYRTGSGQYSELTKRIRSIINGGTYPSLTLQAMIYSTAGARKGAPSDWTILNAYVVRTEELYRHVITLLDGDDDHFRLCGCCTKEKLAPDGARFVGVAITEEGRQLTGTKDSLLANGVDVRMLRHRTEALGLW